MHAIDYLGFGCFSFFKFIPLKKIQTITKTVERQKQANCHDLREKTSIFTHIKHSDFLTTKNKMQAKCFHQPNA